MFSDLFEYSIVSGKLYHRQGRNSGKQAGYLHKGTGYWCVAVKGKTYYAHRIAWLLLNGAWPDFIDHEDQIRHHNQWINLRDVAKRTNHQNMRKFSNNTSGVTGVSWSSQLNRWVAKIMVNNQSINLGVFLGKEEAIKARKDAEVLYDFHSNHGKESA